MLELTRSLVALATRSVESASEQVTLQQYRALYVLQGIGPCNAGGLAEQLGLHASSVTRLCDRLVALGLLQRDVRADNRREIQLTLTAAGRAARRRSRPCWTHCRRVRASSSARRSRRCSAPPRTSTGRCPRAGRTDPAALDQGLRRRPWGRVSRRAC